MLKALSNGCFSPIPLDGKRKRNKCLLGRAKVGGASSDDSLWIIPLDWLSFCLSRIGVSVCGKNYIGKSGEDNPRRADDLGTGTDIPDTNNINGRVDNQSRDTDILAMDNIDREVDNPGTGTDTPDTDNINRGADNPSIGTNTLDKNADGGADDLGTRIADVDRQVAASNKAHVSLFSLRKALFFLSLLLNRRLSPLFCHPHLFLYCFQWPWWSEKPLFLSIWWPKYTCLVSIRPHLQWVLYWHHQGFSLGISSLG